MPPAEMRKQIKTRNIIDVDQVAKLNKFLSNAAVKNGHPKLFVSIDQEGGRVSRLLPEHGFNHVVPSAADIAKTMHGDSVRTMYSELGNGLSKLGFNINFAPDVDVNVNPNSPAIGAMGRSFSLHPSVVTTYGRAAANGLTDAGVLYSYKHFPGHGSATNDTHDGVVDITKTWTASELIPYKELVYTDMPGMVMVAHVRNDNLDPEFPASLSYKIITGLLRNQIGFDGVVTSDDLQMGAIYETYGLRETLRYAILAGNDVMLLGNNLMYTQNLGRVAHAEIMDMVNRGEVPKSRIKQSYDRIFRLKNKLK